MLDVGKAFPFSNVRTEVSSEGTCVGLAKMIADKYNRGGISHVEDFTRSFISSYTGLDSNPDFEKTYNFKKNDKVASENYVLYSFGIPCLSSYKDETFTKEDGWIKDNLNEGEYEFMKAAVGFWRNENNRFTGDGHYVARGFSAYRFDKIVNVLDEIDTIMEPQKGASQSIPRKQVLMLGYGDNDLAHCVNIYDYEIRDREGSVYKEKNLTPSEQEKAEKYDIDDLKADPMSYNVRSTLKALRLSFKF